MRLVYFSPVPWASFHQRPHHFVKWFNERTGGEVVWVEPYPTRLPTAGDFFPSVQAKTNVEVFQPDWLRVLRPFALPIEPLPILCGVNSIFWQRVYDEIESFVINNSCQIVVGKPSKLALNVLKLFPQIVSYYDAMDDFPAFYSGLSRLSMASVERAVSDRAGGVLASSRSLVEKFVAYGKKVSPALNACNLSSLPSVECCLKKKFKMPAVVGYVGTIGQWFDWQLVLTLARQNPAVIFRLIGPLHTLPPQDIPANIEVLPARPHAEAIRAMLDFSAGLIPFQLSELTSSVDPIKYYEYRAMGLPVISTAFGEMAFRQDELGVFIVRETTSVGTVVKNALEMSSNESDVQNFHMKNCWPARFDQCGLFAN